MFTLNLRSGAGHRNPSHEQCNVDQIPDKHREKFSTMADMEDHPRFKALCRHCFKET